jgi:hypothetical protein
MSNALNEMQKILEKELKHNKVKVRKWCRDSCGCAFHNTREIKIPKPVDFDTLGVCFHEIGHVVLGHVDGTKTGKTRYAEEYEAEMFAIDKLREYDLYNKQYEYRAISHVLMKLAQAKNRGHNMKNVPKEIVRWTGLQVNKWNKAHKAYVVVYDYKRKGDIKVGLYNKRGTLIK